MRGKLFLKGLPLARMVDRRLAIDLDLFSRGGMRVLDKIERQDYDVLARRPHISKAERVRLLLGTLARRGVCEGRMTVTLERSYEHCRQVARSRARNFYYSFVLLPTPQRNAMCAIYAFMRYCDDLSDERRGGARRGRRSNTGARNSTRRSTAASAGTPAGRRFTTPCSASASRTSTSTR